MHAFIILGLIVFINVLIYLFVNTIILERKFSLWLGIETIVFGVFSFFIFLFFTTSVFISLTGLLLIIGYCLVVSIVELFKN